MTGAVLDSPRPLPDLVDVHPTAVSPPALGARRGRQAYLVKIGSTYRFDEQGVGADAHLHAVLLGIVVVSVVLVGAVWWVRWRAAGSPAAPRTAGPPR